MKRIPLDNKWEAVHIKLFDKSATEPYKHLIRPFCIEHKARWCSSCDYPSVEVYNKCLFLENLLFKY